MNLQKPIFKQSFSRNLDEYILPTNEPIITHLPFNITLLSDNSEMVSDYICKLSHYMMTKKQKYMVIHYGSANTNDEAMYKSIKIIERFLKDTENDNSILCIENSALSKNYRKRGSVSHLYSLIKKINHKRIRLCFDTEHAFASGYKIDVAKLKEVVGLIHFNPIPDIVDFGSRLDLHTNYSLFQSTNIEEYLKPIYLNFCMEVPFVVEAIKDNTGRFFKEVLKYDSRQNLFMYPGLAEYYYGQQKGIIGNQ